MIARSVFILSAAFVAGCAAPNASNSTYAPSSLTSATRTVEGVILSKRAVKVAGSTGTGTATGGALGAVAGSSVGSSTRDGLAGAIVGAVIGGAIGAAAERNSTQIDAFEYIVRSDVTGLMTVIQADDGLLPGDKVFIVLATKPVLVKNETK